MYWRATFSEKDYIPGNVFPKKCVGPVAVRAAPVGCGQRVVLLVPHWPFRNERNPKNDPNSNISKAAPIGFNMMFDPKFENIVSGEMFFVVFETKSGALWDG